MCKTVLKQSENYSTRLLYSLTILVQLLVMTLLSYLKDRLKSVKNYIARKFWLLYYRPRKMVSDRKGLEEKKRVQYTIALPEAPTVSKKKDDINGLVPEITEEETSQWSHCTDMPVGMKSAQGIFFYGELHIGGGHTGSSATDSVIYKYNPKQDSWSSLPSSPMKWFGLTVFDQKLVIVGGKEVGNRKSEYTNKIASWDREKLTWNFSLPPMTFARVSPVVIKSNEYLITAGGMKGSLDYNVELLNPNTGRWVIAPSLPVKCFPQTSATAQNMWFLVDNEYDQCNMFRTDMREFIQHALTCCYTGAGNKDDKSQENDRWQDAKMERETKTTRGFEGREGKRIWERMQFPPEKIISTAIINDSCPLVITLKDDSIRLYVYNHQMRDFFLKCSSKGDVSSSAVGDNQKRLFLFGGDKQTAQYSNKMHVFTLEDK